LVFGYVNYAAPALACPLRFTDAPRAVTGGRPGSTLGGTGIGISRRCDVSPGLIRHLTWLMGEAAQTGFIPAHGGQPSRRSAWQDDAVNAAGGDFYRGTAATLEAAWVRPRHSGYVAFQSGASALIREALAARTPAGRLLAALQDLYRASSDPGQTLGALA
jgi:multiple sugar transport system substrate-binding protein